MAERRAGARHWLAQRLTAFALAPLGFWFMIAVSTKAGADRAEIAGWIGDPPTALALLVLLGVTLWHALQGVEVVLVDYVRDAAQRHRVLYLLRLIAAALGTLGALAIGALVIGNA
jgi:succinate dehydrogenase / fumarate reductase, membrane anchor subunit